MVILYNKNEFFAIIIDELCILTTMDLTNKIDCVMDECNGLLIVFFVNQQKMSLKV